MVNLFNKLFVTLLYLDVVFFTGSTVFVMWSPLRLTDVHELLIKVPQRQKT